MDFELTYIQCYIVEHLTPDVVLGIFIAVICSFIMEMAGRESASSDYDFTTTWFYRLIGAILFAFSAYCLSR